MNHPIKLLPNWSNNWTFNPTGRRFLWETYRSVGSIDVPCLDGPYQSARNYATCIYFYWPPRIFFGLSPHTSGRGMAFYEGAPPPAPRHYPIGVYSKHLIGSPLLDEATRSLSLPGGSWFAAEVQDSNQYTLLGCTVSPGFSFEDFWTGAAQYFKQTISQTLHTYRTAYRSWSNQLNLIKE